MNSFSLFGLVRQILSSLCQILLQPVLAENEHPFEKLPLRMSNPKGLFTLTS